MYELTKRDIEADAPESDNAKSASGSGSGDGGDAAQRTMHNAIKASVALSHPWRRRRQGCGSDRSNGARAGCGDLSIANWAN
ncbi:hypothetical protein VTH06DRAFT_2027 [Thermothelomyces fergusii]